MVAVRLGVKSFYEAPEISLESILAGSTGTIALVNSGTHTIEFCHGRIKNLYTYICENLFLILSNLCKMFLLALELLYLLSELHDLECYPLSANLKDMSGALTISFVNRKPISAIIIETQWMYPWCACILSFFCKNSLIWWYLLMSTRINFHMNHFLDKASNRATQLLPLE